MGAKLLLAFLDGGGGGAGRPREGVGGAGALKGGGEAA